MEDRLDRTERIIAGARLVLALAGINLVILVSEGAAFESNGAYTTVILYLLYAIAVLWIADHNLLPFRHLGLITQVADSLWFAVILLFTGTEQSPFFLYYVFSLTTASFRWGFSTTLLVNTANVGLYGIIHLATLHGHLQFHEFLVRPTYLYVLACLLGYLGEHQNRLQKRLLSLTELSRSIGFKGSFTRMLDDLMSRLCSIFQAEQCTVVLHDRENLRTVLKMTGNAGGNENAHMIELQPREAQLFLMDERDHGYLFSPYTRLAKLLGWREFIVYDFETEKPEANHPQQLQRLMSILEAQSLLSAPLIFSDQLGGRIYLVNRTKGYFSFADLQYLRLIVAQVAPLMEKYRLLKNMQALTVLEEKSRIARDLHDGLVQSLASLDLRLEVCRRLAGPHPELINEELSELQRIVKAEYAGLREYMMQLRTSTYPDKDLLKAIQKYAQALEREDGLVVKISLDLEQITLSPSVSGELYQIIHEGLTNIRKHAGARQAIIHLDQDDKAIHLLISDDGTGFPAKPISGCDCDPPWSIAERVRSLNGTLRVDSQPGKGTTLQIRIPMEDTQKTSTPTLPEWNGPLREEEREGFAVRKDGVYPC